MKALLGLTAASALLVSLPSFACTPDEIDVKARELAANVHTLTQSDPQIATEIYREVRKMRLDYTAEELPNECAAYEQRLLDLEEAAAQAEHNWKKNYY
ncbi:hypothetical protein [Azotobacter salinestris]|uniref:hypothetical protein n=1 Tax=Azotobacter salinestris TaxID=69964 RepID=UPI0032DE6ED7